MTDPAAPLPAAPLPRVTTAAPDASGRADAVVIGLHQSGAGATLAAGAGPLADALGDRLAAALDALDAEGRPGEVLKIPTLGLADAPLLVATGLGPAPADGTQIDAETARRAVGAALRVLTGRRRVHVAIDAPAGALAEGALFGAYSYPAYKSAPPKRALRTVTVSAPASARADVRRAAVLGEAVAVCRDLVNTPPNDLFPESFAARAAALAGARDLDVEVLDERALKRGGYGGVRGVGQGSSRPPRLVRISYRPKRARGHLAFVGKGVTFDSGGLNLKPGSSMLWMKSDMGGAAAAICAVVALAELRVPVAVTVTTPMVENLPSATSYRPSDILTLKNGTTVEVGNTDAEGRLILADAITRAAEDEPDRLIELSTLTGAQVVALGDRVIGAMGSDGWRDEVVAAANAAGEAAWAMPLPAELRAGLDSPVADLVNVATEGGAGMLVAGHFLASFVPDGLPWAHLDIAGPSYNNGSPRDYTPKGGTGAGVRTLVSAAERFAGR
ncbi:leucyl aminopeptidase [uncultured Jatrophihabitans sp.]|uniref:leucyl aminopeptidase n=1 Tax=uncultured Jatrophihabitans sp. TaxID=1610747 RepID=UPI0035CB71E5